MKTLRADRRLSRDAFDRDGQPALILGVIAGQYAGSSMIVRLDAANGVAG
jgi:hypothetical protein